MSNTKLCRICVREVEEFVCLLNLYYEDTEVSLFTKDILHIQMEEDTSTLVICKTCNKVLNNFHQFYRMVKQAQKQYEKLHIKTDFIKVEKEDVEENYNNDKNKCNSSKKKKTSKMKAKSLKTKLIHPNVLGSIYTEDSLDHSHSVVENNMSPDAVVKVEVVENDISNGEDVDNIPVESFKTKKKLKNSKTVKKSVKLPMVTNKTIVRIKSGQSLRSKEATKTVLSKYNMEELCRDGEWLLNEDELDWVLRLFVDMKCVRCEYAVDRYRLLQEHCISAHGKDPSLECCGFTAPHFASIQSHILHTHILQHSIQWKLRFVLCPKCGKSVRLTTLKDHMSSHLPHDKRKYQCDICHSGFNLISRLRSHKKAVHPSTTIPCDECDKVFKNKTNLKSHKWKVHNPGDNVFLCPDCGKRMKTLMSYTNHMNIHKGIDDRVKCSVCSTVVKKMNLTKHMRVHDPNNYKQCPQCAYRGLNLREHILTVHDKMKAHACSYCDMTFQKEVRMRDHEASRHTGIPRYTCEYCDKTFMFDGKYRKHCKLMHPTQYAEKKLAEDRRKNTANVPVATKRTHYNIIEEPDDSPKNNPIHTMDSENN